MRSARLKLRLFLEGQEVPVISGVVSGGINQPASAAIQIVPTDDVHNLLPRTLVHLFFFDLHPDPPALEALQAADTVGYPGLSKELQSALGDNYRLLFTGEMVGYSFSRSPGGRAVTLQCLDFSSYWDVAKQYFLTGGENSAASKVAAFVGASQRSFKEDDSTTPVQLLLNILTGKAATMPQLDGLLGGVIRLLETIGGVYRGRGEKFQGLNDFFAAAELRLRLSQMLGASAKDTSSKHLFAHKEFRGWLRQTLGRNRSTVSYRQILEVVLGRIYHDYVSVPAPAFRPAFDTTVKVRVPVKGSLPKNLPEAVKKRMAALKEYEATAKGVDSSAASTAALAKLQAKMATYEDGPTITSIEQGTGADKKTRRLGQAAGADRKFVEAVRDFHQTEGHALDPDDPTGKRKITDSTLDRLRNEAERGYLRSYGVGGSKVIEKTATVMERLITHVFRPHIYFCAPPRCNVFFPDLYTSFQWQRSYMEEVTRLQLTASGEYVSDGLITEGGKQQKYYAPNIEYAKGSFTATSAKKGSRFLMPHEKFTGILPHFENVSDLSAFQEIVKDQGGGRPKVEYLQKLANFDFFDKRFGPRVGGLSGPFNPYVVPGAPALIIDQYRADSFRQSYGITPTQVLGLVQNLRHVISIQGQGTTSVQLSHMRTHNERVEFLGPLLHTFRESVPVGKAILETFSTLVDSGGDLTGALKGAGQALLSGDPNAAHGTLGFGRINAQDLAENPEMLVGDTVKGIGVKTVGHTPDGKAITSVTTTDRFSKRLGELVSWAQSSSPEVGTFAEATYLVQKYRGVDRAVEIPLDKALFPPWMSPIYANINIGRDFYSELFGIGSICDPVQIGYQDTKMGYPGLSFLPDSVTAQEANSLTSEARDNLKGIFDTGSAVAGDLRAEVELGATLEQAVDQLVETYKALQEGEFDFDALFKAYCWRPVATLRQVLGAPDFDLSTAPKSAVGLLGSLGPMASKAKEAAKKVTQSKINAFSGFPGGRPAAIDQAFTVGETEGFHSRAFGNFDAMQYLDHPGAGLVGGKGTVRTVDPSVDPRGERWRRVQSYLAVLSADRGLLG